MNIFNNYLSILSEKDKVKFSLLSISFVFLAFMEGISLALIFPIVGIFQNENFLKNIDSNLLNQILDFKTFINLQISDILFLCLLICFLFFLKGFLSFIIQKFQIRFTFNIEKKIQNKLFQKYMFANMDFHIKSKSSELLKNLIQETNKVSNTIHCSAYLISSIATVLILISLMLYVEKNITLIALSFFLISNAIIILLSKNFISKIGEQRFFFNSKRTDIYNTGIRDIKEIKINEKESFFTNFLKKYNKNFFDAEAKIDVINIIPMIIIEILFISLIIFVLYFIYLNTTININEFIPKLSLFAATSIKLIPALNRGVIMINKIRYNYSAVNIIKKEFKLKEEKKPQNKEIYSLKKNILIKNVNFSYEKKKPILKNLNLKIKRNSTICIYGKSGQGKSTILDILMGIKNPNKGKILCDGKNINNNISQFRKLIGYVPQNVSIFEDTIENNIVFGSKKKIDKQNLISCLKIADLNKFVLNLPKKEKTIIKESGKTISGGQKQKIGLARAMVKNPKILILDEPTSSLDIKSRIRIYKNLRRLKKNKTIIIVSHDKNNIKFCDKYYKLIDRGLMIS